MRIAADGKVGIGTNNPIGLLQVRLNDASPPTSITNISDLAADEMVRISMGSVGTAGKFGLVFDVNTSSSSLMQSAVIAGRCDSGADWGTTLGFYTHPATSSSGDLYERMRINEYGNVGIGTTNPVVKLDVIGSGIRCKYTTQGISSIGGSYTQTLVLGATGGASDVLSITTVSGNNSWLCIVTDESLGTYGVFSMSYWSGTVTSITSSLGGTITVTKSAATNTFNVTNTTGSNKETQVQVIGSPIANATVS